jgi:hypothetical protein
VGTEGVRCTTYKAKPSGRKRGRPPRKAREEPVSLFPLSFEEAVRELLQVKPETEETRKGSRKHSGVRKPAG